MAKIKIKNSVTAGSAPSGLSFGEMAVNITDRKIFIGNAVEGVVTLHDQQNVVTSVDGVTGAVDISAGTGIGIGVAGKVITINNTGIVSINGETGSVIGVAYTTQSNNFTPLQNFTSGISASAGSSFSNATVFISNLTANVDPLHVQHSSTGALKVSTSGQARAGAIKLGNSTTSTFNTFINNNDGTLTFYNGISTTGSNMINFNTTTMNISPTIAGATFSGLIRSTSGISASGGITTASYVYAESGFRVGSGAINSQTGTTYTLLAADNGEIIVWNTSAGATLTIPSGLPVGFNATLIQTGTAAIGITGSGTTLNSFEGKLRTAGQHAAVSIISYSSNVFNVAGGLTA